MTKNVISDAKHHEADEKAAQYFESHCNCSGLGAGEDG